MPPNDDYFDDTADDAADFAAAIEAAERRQNAGPSNIIRAVPANNARADQAGEGGTKGPVKQFAPQKVSKPTSSSSIIVNTRQKDNPILISIKLPWEYGDIVPDYVLGASTCALFLSLKYHRLYPEYIYRRIKNIAHAYHLRVLLVLVDTEQHPEALRELTKTCLVNDLTLILAWSAAEAGKYLELYKTLEHAPPTKIKERAKTDYVDQVVEMVTQIRGVNKNDAVSLITMFGSVRGAINATDTQIGLVGGWGEKKVARWTRAVREPFRAAKSRKVVSEKPLPLNTTKGIDQAAINARMGIGRKDRPVRADGSSRAMPMDVDAIEDDEEALAAVAEFEAEEARAMAAVMGRQAPMAPPLLPVANDKQTSITSGHQRVENEDEDEEEGDVPSGVMAALAKLRQ